MSSCCQNACASDASSKKEVVQWFKLGIAAFIAMQAMFIGIAVNETPPEGMSRIVLHLALAVSSIMVFLLAGLPIATEAFAKMKRGKIVTEQLFLIGIFGAFAASVQASFTDTGDIYYEVVAVLVAIYTLGSVLGRRRQKSAIGAAEALAKDFEMCLKLTCCGESKQVAVSEVEKGDRVMVPVGEGVPVDGQVVKGTAFVRETPLTGEPFPVVKREGDKVLAGAEVLDEPLVIQAQASGKERKLDSLLQVIRESSAAPSSLQREADRLVSWFLPIVLILSVTTFVGWTLAVGWQPALFYALAVLVVACPCAMGLATPIAIWSALNAFAARGVAAVNGDFIEKLSQVKRVVFDKTGTLSEENLALVDFVTLPEVDREVLQGEIAMVEARSSHPIAKAFCAWVVKGDKEVEVGDVRTVSGIGVEAEVSGRLIQIGNKGLLNKKDDSKIEQLQNLLKADDQGASQKIYIKANGQLVGLALFREGLRESAKLAISELASYGVPLDILTGDKQESVDRLGLQNLEGVRSGLLPEDKVKLIEEWENKDEKVLFVGDGVNDSAAMSKASASLAMASGAKLTREVADAQLFGADLTAIPHLLGMARQVRRGIRQNILFAFCYNAIGIALAMAGMIQPIWAALLMMGSSFLVTWRAIRFGQRLMDQTKDEIAKEFLAEKRSRKSLSVSQSSKAPATFILPRWLIGACALGMFLQGPLLAWMGRFSWQVAIMVSLGALLLGFVLSQGMSAWSKKSTLGLYLGMLSLGNLGMLLGWVVDSGFGPVIQDGLCLCGCTKTEGVASFLFQPSWMQGLMVLLSFPVLVITDSQVRIEQGVKESSPWGHLLICCLGMLVGMFFPMVLMSLTNIANHQMYFILTYLAMSSGMLLGMFVFCRSYFYILRKAKSS
ncbi:MAG: cation-translocating P-type ATPase [Verrucomicrobiota bacterium]